MRVLVSRVRKLEASAAAAESADSGSGLNSEGVWAPCPETIVWSRDDARMALPLAAGEHLAVDVQCTALTPELTFACTERVSTTDGDLGIFRDRRGDVIGCVTAIAGDIVRLEVTVQFDAAGFRRGLSQAKALKPGM